MLNKHFDSICLIVIIFAVGLTVAFMNGERLGLEPVRASSGYESRLFDTSYVHSIDVVMDEFDEMCRLADKKKWFDCVAVIDGEKCANVSIRVKGNTAQVGSAGSSKYSFKIEFDHTNKFESYHGLDKLDLSNCAGDSTFMKDYLVYEAMAKAEVPSPLASYAYLTVNGEDVGLYLAVESVEDAFLLRNFGHDSGVLYKPECDETVYASAEMSVGRDPEIAQPEENIVGRTDDNAGRDVTFENPMDHVDPGVLSEADRAALEAEEAERAALEEAEAERVALDDAEVSDPNAQNGLDDEQVQSMDDGSADGSADDVSADGSSGDGSADENAGEQIHENIAGENSAAETGDSSSSNADGVTGVQGVLDTVAIVRPDDIKLIYVDDDPESYPNIFANAKKDISKKDRYRLIKAIRDLNDKGSADSAVDIDEVISYFAVHNFVVSWNSYTGETCGNYYLYEKNGKLSILPWDYGSAFGTYRMQDAGRMINYPIDTPLLRGLEGERPLFDWIMNDQRYVTAYHAVLRDLVTFDSEEGTVSDRIHAVEEMLTPYVAKDHNKFASETAFHKGVNTLIRFWELRAQSVTGQLDGSIPSTYEGQQEAPEKLIDATEIELIDLK